MTGKGTIGINIDGVLRDTVSAMCRVYNAHSQSRNSVAPEALSTCILKDAFPDVEDQESFFFDDWAYSVLRESPIFEKSREALVELMDMGYSIVLFCSHYRNLKRKNLTLQWLSKYNIPYHAIMFSKEGNFARLDYLVDHRPQALENKEEGVIPICISTPYNKGLERTMRRYDSLYDFAQDLKVSSL